jgi:hypothetical protein
MEKMCEASIIYQKGLLGYEKKIGNVKEETFRRGKKKKKKNQIPSSETRTKNGQTLRKENPKPIRLARFASVFAHSRETFFVLLNSNGEWRVW